MNKDQTKEFLNIFANPTHLLEDESQSFAMNKLHSEILKEIHSEDLYGTSLDGVECDLDSFIEICEERGVEPMELIGEFLELMLSNQKTVEFQGQEFSLEGLPNFFIQAKENFIKEKKSEDINNF